MSRVGKASTRIDILDDMTKEEIIHFVRQRAPWGFKLPSEHDVLMLRWNKQVNQLQRDEKEAHERFAKIDFSERDLIAKQFNSETDLDKKMALFEKLAVYQQYLDDHMEEFRTFRKRDEALNKLFEKAQRSTR